jgi:hypothetical protein
MVVTVRYFIKKNRPGESSRIFSKLEFKYFDISCTETYLLNKMRLVQTTTNWAWNRYKNINLFDLHIKGQGHSDVILILDMPLCPSTFTYKRWRHCDCHFFNVWPLQPMFSFGHYFVLDWIFIWKEYLTSFTIIFPFLGLENSTPKYILRKPM